MRDDLMVQQQVDNSWQHMVGVICLTQTGRKQVKSVPSILFGICSTSYIIKYNTSTQLNHNQSLGMVNVREKRLRSMSSRLFNMGR